MLSCTVPSCAKVTPVKRAAFLQPLDRSSQMGDRYGTSHDQRYVERIEEFRIGNTFLRTTYYVICDAVVASQYE